MSNADVLSRSVAVIRSYNNSHVVKRVKSFLKMGFGRILVVVKANQDQGSTRGWLRHLRDERVHIIEMFDGYHWSTALNAAAQHVINNNLFAEKKFEFIFNVSVEALFDDSHVMQMAEAIASNPRLGSVGTSFEGRHEGRVVQLGRSYNHPRNTGMFIRVQALEDGHLFNSACDGMGGMEDIDFILKLLVISDWTYEMLDLQVRLILQQHWNQEDKEKREQSAMNKIMAYWRGICPLAGPEIDRVERAIAQMQLEEE